MNEEDHIKNKKLIEENIIGIETQIWKEETHDLPFCNKQFEMAKAKVVEFDNEFKKIMDTLQNKTKLNDQKKQKLENLITKSTSDYDYLINKQATDYNQIQIVNNQIK